MNDRTPLSQLWSEGIGGLVPSPIYLPLLAFMGPSLRGGKSLCSWHQEEVNVLVNLSAGLLTSSSSSSCGSPGVPPSIPGGLCILTGEWQHLDSESGRLP